MLIDNQIIIELGISIIAFGIGFLTRHCIQIPINNRLWYIRRRLEIYIDRLSIHKDVMAQTPYIPKFHSIEIEGLTDITNRLISELNNFYGVKL